MTGVDMTHVTYKGSAPALTDLIAGRVQVMIDNLPAAQPFAEGGQIRPLAVSTATRWPLLPDLPTIAEAGVPGYEAASWFTIGAPAKTPKEIIDRLNASVDVDISNCVVNLSGDKPKTIAEAARVLRPGGRFRSRT